MTTTESRPIDLVERVPLAFQSQAHIRTTMKIVSWQKDDPDVAYVKTPYLQRINWKDGSLVFCKKCDGDVPMRAVDGQLVCSEGHKTHPANVVVSKGAE